MNSLSSNNEADFRFVWEPQLKQFGFEDGFFSRRCATCLKEFFGSEDSVVCKRCANNVLVRKKEKLQAGYKKTHFEKLEQLIKDDNE